jgi:PAS domain S-box-containing protein
VEVGVWRNSADRERLVQAVRRDGSVQDLYLEFNVKQGRVVALMISGTRFQSEGQDYLLLNGRDVSEMARVRREREAILANASVGIAFLRQRRFELANAPFEQMFGWQPGTLVGQGSGVLCPGEHDAAHARMIDELTPALRRGEAVDLERAARRRDGTVFRLRLRAKAIDPRDLRDHGIILIAEDVTAARQAEQALADARDAAEAASRAKSAFLANTSHEIRTPLNGLLGLARLARQPGLAPALRQQYVEQIGDCAELLAMVITDILDVAKIEAGKLRLEAAPFDLHALLQALQRSHAALAAEQGLDFDTQLDAALPQHVLGDALRLRQILGNLLHNALKFTATGSIRLEARPLPGERVRFEVHDTGPGIDAATQARLFEPFSQADASITRRYGGTGLGLAICRELTTLMGGQVGLDSAPGRGSIFHAELPLPALPDSAVPAIAAPANAARLQGMRVLLVEDNEVNMLIATALLTQWGVQVTPAADGQQALDEVTHAADGGRLFDAVLMDLQMPGLSGFDATEVLRRQHGPAELPVIALTAAALASERDQAARIGMNDFLTKPIDPLRLREALLRVLPQRDDAPPA